MCTVGDSGLQEDEGAFPCPGCSSSAVTGQGWAGPSGVMMFHLLDVQALEVGWESPAVGGQGDTSSMCHVPHWNLDRT